MKQGCQTEELPLIEAIQALGPSQEQLARWSPHVQAEVERLRKPLVDEWTELIRFRPLMSVGLALAAAVALLVTTPIGAILGSLLGMAVG